jgi:DNA-binding MarR family transcriptional regulator
MTDAVTPLIGLLLRLANQRWASDMDDALRELGVEHLTGAHARVIPFVPPEGASIQELARRANVRKQTMAESVEQLVASGYVQRRQNPTDRRASIVLLTEKGRALRPMSHNAGNRVQSQWEHEVGPDALQQLRDALLALTKYGVEAEGGDGEH